MNTEAFRATLRAWDHENTTDYERSLATTIIEKVSEGDYYDGAERDAMFSRQYLFPKEPEALLYLIVLPPERPAELPLLWVYSEIRKDFIGRDLAVYKSLFVNRNLVVNDAIVLSSPISETEARGYYYEIQKLPSEYVRFDESGIFSTQLLH